MADTLILLILVTAGDAHADITAAATSASREVFGSEHALMVQKSVAQPADAELERLAEERAVPVVATVSFLDHSGRVLVHAFRRDRRRWLDRELKFTVRDAPVERGRALGFALAAFVPEEIQERRAETSASRVETGENASGATGEVADGAGTTEGILSTEPPLEARSTPPERVQRPAPPVAPSAEPGLKLATATNLESQSQVDSDRLPRTELDARFLAAFAPHDYGGGFGAAVSAQHYFALFIGLSFEVGGRIAQIAPAQVSTRTFWAGAGVSGRFFLAKRWEFSGWTRAAGILEMAVRTSSAGQSYQSRVLSGVSAGAELGFLFSRTSAVTLGTGVEYALGRTELVINNELTAKIEQLRILAALGMRIYF